VGTLLRHSVVEWLSDTSGVTFHVSRHSQVITWQSQVITCAFVCVCVTSDCVEAQPSDNMTVPSNNVCVCLCVCY